MELLSVNIPQIRRRRDPDILSSGSVQVWGQNVYYEASGMAEQGPTILFLHESGGTSATWHGQLVGLAHTAHCVVPDLSGHGHSEGLGCPTVAEYRMEVMGFLDALAIRWPIVVAGIGLGAAIAMDLAEQSPERVAGLVLSGAVGGGRASELTRAATAVGEAPPSYIASLFSQGVPQRMFDERLKRWRLTSPLVRHRDLTAEAAYPWKEALRRVSHPILLVAGDEDTIASPDQTREVAQSLPSAQVVTIARAGCLSMMEQPRAYSQAVAAYVAELGSARPAMPQVNHPGAYRRFRSV